MIIKKYYKNGTTLRQKAYLKNAATIFTKQTGMVFDMELQMGSNEFLQLKGMQNYNPSNLEIRKWQTDLLYKRDSNPKC